MPTHKISLLTGFILLNIFVSITILSCEKDSCKNVSCKNGGSCADGTCSCATGYKGILCEELERDAFLGSYQGNSGGSTYTLTINPGISDIDFKINNFNNWGIATGYWTNSGCTIPEQSLGGGVIVKNGAISKTGNNIQINYQEFYSGTGGGTWLSKTFNGVKL